MVKDFSCNINPWNALLFEKTLKQLPILDIENYGFILNTCHDTAKRAETRLGFPVIFSRLWWPIEPKFSQVCYFTYKLWYTKCGPLVNTVYRKCPMALKALCCVMGLLYPAHVDYTPLCYIQASYKVALKNKDLGKELEESHRITPKVFLALLPGTCCTTILFNSTFISILKNCIHWV